MVGSIPPSLNDCTSRARPGAARMNAPRRGRPPPPCTRPCKGGAATGHDSRRASPYRAGYGGLLPGEVKKAGWLAGWLAAGRVAVARNLPRLVIHVAGLCCGPVHLLSYGEFEVSEQLSEGATNGRPQEEKKGSWEMGRRTRLLLLQLVMVLKER
ncbi:hypothetical protein PVAP13_2NG398603 [Panicum virgatum]|uniref:Uncharacterized protein n=1 Tax=Panicum virgatum TaxID=38727 RepID=A0A8T0VW17_PANVG|nr:hypothetical protein PVAP13_2NG398603 [Panicum virgatum]